MARKKREWYPGAIYHVMSRGNRKTEIFKDGCDCYIFLEHVKMIKEKYDFTIHSVCLMTNHFHMEIETQDTEIWKIMQKILTLYACYYNRKYSYSGHVFEGRYASSLIEDDNYFLEVSRYIHLNPVKAMMVREPAAYEYSSYEHFIYDECDRRKSKISTAIAEIVDTSRVLSAFGDNSREQYRMFVEGKMSHKDQELLIQKDMGEDEMWLP